MSDEYQIEIPQSFIALFVEPGRQKPNAARDEISGRYELCEDMAVMLSETARNMFYTLGIAEHDVLRRINSGLTGQDAVVTPNEAWWVVQRLAELLNWPHSIPTSQPGPALLHQSGNASSGPLM